MNPVKKEKGRPAVPGRPIEKFLYAYESVAGKPARRNGRGWMGCCPAHDDDKPSLAISEAEDGRVLLHCHAGCRPEEVVAALGLSMRDLMTGNPRPPTPTKPLRNTTKGKVLSRGNAKRYPTAAAAIAELERVHGPRSAYWTYRNAVGEPVGVVVRWDKPEGKDYRPVARVDGEWVVGAMPVPRPLYRLPELAGAQQVFVLEGEKAVEALRTLGFLATTSAGGAQAADKSDWSPLAGCEVIVSPDNNEAGERYVADVAKCLAAVVPATTLRIMRLPDLPEGGDVADFIAARRAAGATDDRIRDDIERLADQAESALVDTDEPQIVLLPMASVKPESVKWLWPGCIPMGKLTVIAGDPGLGKSFLTLDIAARTSRGTDWADCVNPNSAGGVVLMSAEDDPADTIRPRLDSAGADVEQVVLLEGMRIREEDGERTAPVTLDHVAMLQKAIECTPNCKLVIVDPISAFMGKVDTHVNAQVRAVLAPLAGLAASHGIAVVAVTHLRKGEGAAIYRAMGSLAFVAAARTVWVVTKDRDDATGGRRLFLPVKNNLASDTDGFAFALGPAGNDAPRVYWESSRVTMDADEVMSFRASKPGRPPDDRERAKAFLLASLADGPRPAKDVTEEACEGEGISKRTLDRARQDLGVRAYRPTNPGPWWWRLPDGSGPTPRPHGQGDSGNLAICPADPANDENHVTTDVQDATLPDCQHGVGGIARAEEIDDNVAIEERGPAESDRRLGWQEYAVDSKLRPFAENSNTIHWVTDGSLASRVRELAAPRDGWSPGNWHADLLRRASACEAQHPELAADYRAAAAAMAS